MVMALPSRTDPFCFLLTPTSNDSPWTHSRGGAGTVKRYSIQGCEPETTSPFFGRLLLFFPDRKSAFVGRFFGCQERTKQKNRLCFFRLILFPLTPTPISPTYLYANPEKPTEIDRHFRQGEAKNPPSHAPSRSQPYPRDTMTPYVRSCRHTIPTYSHRTRRNVIWLISPKKRPKSVRFGSVWVFLIKTDRNLPPFGPKNEKQTAQFSIFGSHPWRHPSPLQKKKNGYRDSFLRFENRYDVQQQSCSY